MGSNLQGFMDMAEAAEILNCTEERIEYLCTSGSLRHQLTSEGRRVHIGDVDEARRLSAEGALPMSELTRKVVFLEAQVQRLEEAVNVLFSINGMLASRFSKMTNSQLVDLFHVLDRDIGVNVWPVERLLNYCEIFIRIGEDEVHRINVALDIDNSWLVFYELLMNVSKFVANHPELETNLDLQRVKELLAVGRKNIRDVSRYFIERSGESSTSQRLLYDLASNDVDMFDDLARQLKAKSPRGHLALA
jgi:hypothetical protein